MSYERITHIRIPGAQYCLCGRRSLNSNDDAAHATCKRCLHVADHGKHMGSKRYPEGVPQAFTEALARQRITKSELVEVLWYFMRRSVNHDNAAALGDEAAELLKANREAK